MLKKPSKNSYIRIQRRASLSLTCNLQTLDSILMLWWGELLHDAEQDAVKLESITTTALQKQKWNELSK